MKHNVRIISLIVAICCLLSYVPVNAITIPTTAEPEIVLSSASGEAGDEVTVDISLSGNPGVAYLKLKVDYNADLSIVKAENKGVLAVTFTTSKTTSVKPYVLQWMGASDSSNDGVIATVTFKIADNASVGEKSISVAVDECYNAEFDDVTFDVVNGNITVSDAGDPGTDPGVEPTSPQIAIPSETVTCGENVTLNVNLSDNSGIAYLKLKVDYDHTALSLVSASNLGVLSGTFTTSKTTSVKPYVLQWMGADNSTDNGTIATVTFTALKEGETTVSITVDECYNEEFDDVAITTSNATVLVSPAECTHQNTEIRDAQTATCCETGYTGDTYCTDCGEKVASGSVIPATGNHVDADGEWETDGSEHWHTCYYGTKFDVSAHKGGAATCTEKAKCTLCGVEYSGYGAHGETEIRNAKEATCCENGYTGDTYCKDCNNKIASGSVIPATGNHVDADGKWECDGTQHWHTCYYGTQFDVESHTGGTATCTAKAKCSVCGAEYGEYGAHGETEIKNAKEATCCEDGYTGDTYCKDCNTKIASGSVIPATGHHVDADGKWESNGTQHWHTCYYGTHFDVANHIGGTATCTEKAKCSICGMEYGEYAVHQLMHHDRVEPDYENDGNIEYWTCDECGKYFSDSEGNNEIAADDVIIAKLTISEYQFLDGEVIIEAPEGAIPEGSIFDVQKIVPPPAEVVEKVKDQMGSSSEVLAYYEIRLSDTDGELIIHLDGEITIKIQMPEKYVESKCVKVLQEDETGKLITMVSWWEGEYLCYKTDWLEIYN